MNKALATLLLATLSLGGVAQARKPVPEAKPIGKPLDCISIQQIRESRVRSDSIIDFRLVGNKWVRNTLPHSCPALGFEERFSYATSLNKLCSVDTISVLHSYGGDVQEGTRCGLGTFQPVELSKPSKK